MFCLDNMLIPFLSKELKAVYIVFVMVKWQCRGLYSFIYYRTDAMQTSLTIKLVQTFN